MLRQLLVSAILVALASACAQRQTPATEAQPTTSFAPETSKTTVKDIPTTAAAAEPTSTKGPPTTAAVTEAPPTTTKNTPTTETSTNPLPTTTKAVPTAETITDAPSTTTDTLTTKTVTVPTSTKAQPTPDAVTEASTTTVKDIPTTETSTDPQPTTTASLPTTTASTTMTTTEATTTDPEPPRTCAKNGDIKAIFILVDGSGTFKQFWSNVLPFMRLFKEHVSRHIPIWFYQWSSPKGYCELNTMLNRRQSWGCYGKSDPCQSYDLSYPYCPEEQFLPLPANWTEQDFDKTIDRIYGLNQDGWTQPWLYMKHAIDEWKVAKKNMTLGKNDRALLVQITDGQSESGTDWDVVKAFKEENMKFFGVRVFDDRFSMRPYSPIVEDMRKDVVTVRNPATELNGELVKQIVTGGCTPAEATPPRCSANGTMKGVFLMIDGSAAGQVNDSWSRVQPFVKLFKKYVDSEIPIWLMQTSSPRGCDESIYPYCWWFCGSPIRGKVSWECLGDEDNCPGEGDVNTTRCPAKNLERVSPNWDDEKFDAASERIYGILQGGWTLPWFSFIGVGNTWKNEKIQLGFDKDARALVVFVGTGYYQDQSDVIRLAEAAFKSSKVKFLGVEKPIEFKKKVHPMTVYNSLMDPNEDAIIETAADGSGLDEYLVQQIVRYGCN